MRKSRLVAFAAVALALSGCSFGAKPGSASAPTGDGSRGPSTELQVALADGKVTFDEYDAGYRRYKSCMKQAGFDVTDLGVTDRVYQYRLSDEAFKSSAQRDCYVGEFQQLDAQWQVANQDNSEGARILAACLQKQGLPVPDTFEARLKVLDENSIDPASCKKS